MLVVDEFDAVLHMPKPNSLRCVTHDMYVSCRSTHQLHAPKSVAGQTGHPLSLAQQLLPLNQQQVTHETDQALTRFYSCR